MKNIVKICVSLISAPVVLSAACILWPAATAPLPLSGADHVLINVHVIDVESGRAGALQSVVIRNGRITSVGAVPAGAPAPRIDGRGGYLVPGMWDMHSHSLQLSPQLHFPLHVANGVTGVRDMMGCPESDDSLIACTGDKRRWSRAVADGRLVGPRFVGNASFYFDDPSVTPAKAEILARRHIARGVDFLKIYDKVSRPAYMRIARVAREMGTPIAGHLPKAVALDEAISAGQSSFEHARLFLQQCYAYAEDWRQGRLDDVPPIELMMDMVDAHDAAACDRLFARMAASDAWFVPTHVTREEDARAWDAAYLDDPRLAYADPLSRWAWKDDLSATRSRFAGTVGRTALNRYFDKGLSLTARAEAAGVPILVGTDTIVGGFRMHDEMRLLVRAGLSPARVLRAATLDAARYAGQERDFGTVAVGKHADLVLLTANPLDDIGNTRKISGVFLAGRYYDRGALDRLLAFARSQAGNPVNSVKMLWGFANSSISSTL